MPFFTSLILTGGAGLIGLAAYRKSKPLRLGDVLIDGEPKPATLYPPETGGVLADLRELTQDLFGDARQEYQQSLNADYDASSEQDAESIQKNNLVVSVAGLGLATLGLILSPIFYLPSALCSLYSARMFFQDAYRIFAEEGRLDYRAVWALFVPTALLGGFVFTSAFAMFLGIINYYLVAKTENRARQSVADLFGGQIRTVWMLIDGVEVETPIDQVQTNDTVVVQAGQMIPVDGVIINGVATVDQHMLTGESQPAEKSVGDPALAATVVLAGCLYIRVEKAGNATVAAQITEMLSQTTDYKRTLQSRTDRWLNRMAVPVVGLSLMALPILGASGAVAVLWYYPGARMILFGPLSMLSYLQVAAQRRILVKDGRALEVLAEVNTVIFDKTGTLTLEQPTVCRIFCCNDEHGLALTEDDLLRYAAAAEAKQSHPIARAILQAATERNLDLPQLEDAQYKIGYGLKTMIGGRIVGVGSKRFMTMEGIAIPPEIAEQQGASHAQGNSLVLVAVDGQLAGAIELQPTIRPEAHEVIHHLHQRGLNTVIISGDNEAPTQRLSEELGIKRFFAEVLPEDKANLIAQLQTEGHKVCFVGDGINDSIALKTADVAVSLRGATTIATDTAQIVFMDGTLAQLPTLFILSDEFAANMRVNLVASTVPCLIGIAGTFLFGWGMTICLFLYQSNMPIGVYNALKPLLDERQQHRRPENKEISRLQ